MNFIWDIVLRAKRQGYEKEDLFFRQASDCSPYYEQAFGSLNQSRVEDCLIEINALYRFNHIFEEIQHPNLSTGDANHEMDGCIAHLFDVIIHWLCEIDLRHGLSQREYFVAKLRREVLAGDYGEPAAEAMALMDRMTQFMLANELLTQIQTGSGLRAFRRAMRIAFVDCFIYQSNFDRKEILIYLGQKEDGGKQTILRFILDAFLPLDFHTLIFWEHHFGILGVDATMESDKIAIF